MAAQHDGEDSQLAVLRDGILCGNSTFRPGRGRVQHASSVYASVAAPSGAAGGDEEGALLWEYRDDRLKTQGPFTARKLLGWIKAGHLKPSRMARRAPSTPSSTADGGGKRDDFAPLSSAPYFASALAAGALPKAPAAVPKRALKHVLKHTPGRGAQAPCPYFSVLILAILIQELTLY